MLKSLKLLLLSGLVTASLPSYSANQNLENSVQYLTGDTRLACEAILCLSSAYRPSECSPSLNRYFSIDDKKARKKIRKRKNFLNKCPAGDTANANLWVSLIDSISESAEICTADGLNQYTASTAYDTAGAIRYTYRSNQLPSFCTRYWDHEWTYFEKRHLPVYIGSPELRGFWSEPADQAKAQDRFDRWVVQYRDYLSRMQRYRDCQQDENRTCRRPHLSWTHPITE